MQAHAHDLRSEIGKDWESVNKGPAPDDLDAWLHQVVDDWRQCPLRPDVVRLLEYAEKVTLTPTRLSRDDIDALRAAGFSDAAIHDAVQVIAYFSYINRVADALGVEPETFIPKYGSRRF